MEVQFALPAVGFRHCCHARRATSFAASLAAGMAAHPAAAARRAGTSIGARKDQRMHHIAFWCCTVDSDAVLLRARHGGRHEGGGRRQRKRDEELVHLGCTLQDEMPSTDASRGCCVTPRATLEYDGSEHRALWRATSGPRAYTYGIARFKIWESAGRAEPRDHNRLLTPSPRDLHTIDYSFKQRIHEIIP